MAVTRRAVLAGAGVTALAILGVGGGVADDFLPGRLWAMRHLGLDGADGVVPDITAGPTVSGSFVSRRRLGARCGWTIGYPPGSRPGAPLPVLVSLHGRSADHTTSFGTGLHLERFLAQAVARGVPEFAVASIDGGDTYWHQRSDGEDAGAMVTEEFLPLLGAHGLRTSRLGFLGWSMGGYGALHLAGLLGRARVRAVGVMSPALWHTAGETAPGAFDDPADFAANTVFGRQQQLDGVGVLVDCGTGDGFCPAARSYVDGFSQRPAASFQPGAHTLGYWRRMAPQQLAFLGSRL